ncbi:MAG: hypothetical protein ABI354_01920 [Candidatus Saccharimonadales bacterium]
MSYRNIHESFFARPVELRDIQQPYDGVECEVYNFVGDDSEDLAIIRIEPGAMTPRQRVLGGERTVERFVSGSGYLLIGRPAVRSVIQYDFDDSDQRPVYDHVIGLGECMQWCAGPQGLVVAELCSPPYAPGRFEDFNEQLGVHLS